MGIEEDLSNFKNIQIIYASKWSVNIVNKLFVYIYI